MEIINIKDDNDNIILCLGDSNYYGYSFLCDGSVKLLDDSIIKYFDMFKLSENKKELSNEGQYQVFLDNRTNFKHYFLNGVEDFMMFFMNNGEDALLYQVGDNDSKKSSKTKKFSYGKTSITTTLTRGLLDFMMIVTLLWGCGRSLPVVRCVDKSIVELVAVESNLTVDYLINKIYSSNRLNKDEKDFLCNEDFFSDILPYLNNSTYAKFMINRRLNNMDIQNTNVNDGKDYDGILGGYFDLCYPNVIHIYNYCDLESCKDSIAHEFAHMFQEGLDYSLITEASAELLSCEYYCNGLINSYTKEVKLLRMLMEIIGSKPILEYIVSGNFKMIEDEVKPYLSSEDYKLFLDSLSVPLNNLEKRDEKEETLSYLLNDLYKNKYHKDFYQDPVYSALNSPWLSRFYFNDRLKTQERSYYYEVKEIMSLFMAMEKGYVTLYQETTIDGVKKINYISYDDYINYNFDVNHVIEWSTNVDGYSTISGKSFYIFGDKIEIEPFEKINCNEETKKI